ncbi:MAG: zf-HC2 domain-containing protein [Propionibacteriaceae bacterium]
MKEPTCQELAELRSAYLDGALADAERERVLTHLVGCASCRAEVEELRTVRQLLNRMGATESGAASYDLSSRLVSIAGQDAYVPVWSRPFRRTRPGALPSARRTARLRHTAAGLAVGGLVATCGLVGYVAAPTREPAAIADPSDRVRSEFAATLTQFPLASRSVNALMMTPKSRLLTETVAPREATAVGAHRRLSRTQALKSLRRASDQADEVSYTGTQVVSASRGDQTISATVETAFEAGQGSQLTVYNRGGQAVTSGFVPATASSRMVDDETLSLLTRNYQISGWSGGELAGRRVTVVQASEDASSTPAARWWIDDGTGLLLWQETYDEAGRVALASGFTSVDVSVKPGFIEHLAPRLATFSTTSSLTLSSATNLVSRGWFCEGQLGDLSLVRLRSDEPDQPGALHMVYSDGVSTLSVFEQRGRLTAPPVDSRWDDDLGAYVRVGTPSMATWRSGDTVFTVVTDGSLDLVRGAVASLPHEDYSSPTTMERVRAGWVRIIARVVG